MNTNESPVTESASRRNPCFDTDSTIAALNVVADDGISYLLPYAQFLNSERTPNPALEKEPDAPPEKLLIRFAVAQVTVTGTGLNALERALQKCELKFVKSADQRYATTLKSHVAAISITFTKGVA
jgi:hypothetical protein